jgi:hypothetical protein
MRALCEWSDGVGENTVGNNNARSVMSIGSEDLS